MGKMGLCVLLFGLHLGTALGETVWLVDFDQTLVESRREFGGNFRTAYRLFRIDQRANTLQDVASGPRHIDVNPIDYHRIEKDLGRGQGKPGRFRKVKLEDGTTFIAGEYMLRNPDSFIFYGVHQDEPRNYLLEDFKAAEKSTGRFQGELWSLMQYALSNKHSSQHFGVITARGHTKKHWMDFFRYLKNKKGKSGKHTPYINYLPNPTYIHNTSHPDYDQFDLDWDKAKQKIGVLERTIRDLGRVPVSDSDVRLHPDGKIHEKFHTLVYADDNQASLEAAVDLFRQYIWAGVYPIKFIVINTGLKTEIRQTQRPQYAVMKLDGTFRQASYLERLGEPADLTEEQAERILRGDSTCKLALASNG